MPKPKTYPHNGQFLTAKQVAALKKTADIDWVRRRLNTGMTVQEVLDEPVLSYSQSARRGKKNSWWGR